MPFNELALLVCKKFSMLFVAIASHVLLALFTRLMVDRHQRFCLTLWSGRLRYWRTWFIPPVNTSWLDGVVLHGVVQPLIDVQECLDASVTQWVPVLITADHYFLFPAELDCFPLMCCECADRAGWRSFPVAAWLKCDIASYFDHQHVFQWIQPNHFTISTFVDDLEDQESSSVGLVVLRLFASTLRRLRVVLPGIVLLLPIGSFCTGSAVRRRGVRFC